MEYLEKYSQNWTLQIVYIPLINWERGHYREISDQGPGVLTERKQGQYIKAEVWDFPLMTQRMRLRSYLLYGIFIGPAIN